MPGRHAVWSSQSGWSCFTLSWLAWPWLLLLWQSCFSPLPRCWVCWRWWTRGGWSSPQLPGCVRQRWWQEGTLNLVPSHRSSWYWWSDQTPCRHERDDWQATSHLADEQVCDFCFRTQWGNVEDRKPGLGLRRRLGYKLGFVFHIQLHIVVEALKRMRQIEQPKLALCRAARSYASSFLSYCDGEVASLRSLVVPSVLLACHCSLPQI